jgi:ketosteroid isomerase-like protein
MERKVVIDAENELLAAIKNADVLSLQELLHDDLFFNLPNGETITKEMDLKGYRSGKMKIDLLEASNQIISIIEDSAIVCVTVLLQGTHDNHPINGSFRYIRVWKKNNDRLKVIAGSCVAL